MMGIKPRTSGQTASSQLLAKPVFSSQGCHTHLGIRTLVLLLVQQMLQKLSNLPSTDFILSSLSLLSFLLEMYMRKILHSKRKWGTHQVQNLNATISCYRPTYSVRAFIALAEGTSLVPSTGTVAHANSS